MMTTDREKVFLAATEVIQSKHRADTMEAIEAAREKLNKFGNTVSVTGGPYKDSPVYSHALYRKNFSLVMQPQGRGHDLPDAMLCGTLPL
jgi:hypothetical protein